MNPAVESAYITVEDYLAGEEQSQVRHEYIDGIVYAMAGGSRAHNIIAGNFFAEVRAHLRGGPCRPFMADVKVRVRVADKDIFYYPDVVVSCDPQDNDAYYITAPKVIVEVLSENTERFDRLEKFRTYTQLESLEEYVLAAQDKAEVTLFRRANQWKPEVFRRPDQQIDLSSIHFKISIHDIYEGASF